MKAGRTAIRECGIHRRALQALLLALALALALPALALGLGRIVVKSAPGQPLLAEIPVVAADPSELGNLQVRLASPETFRRVGLPAPDADTANLQFTVALDNRGQPVIRVTSAAPLRQPLLTFLIEVDWGAGRLVREYSVLLEAPSSMAAPAQPIQAPTVAAPNTIEREPEPVPAEPTPAVPAEAPVPAAPRTEAVPDAEVASEPLPEAPPAPQPVQPAPEPVPAPATAAPAPASSSMAHTVRAGETLSGIASNLDRGDRSLDQMMLALLQANPEAFIGGNINLVRAGAVLRAPSQDALARYSHGEAAALVRQQVAQWRQAAAAREPANTAGAEGAAPVSSSTVDAGRNAGGARSQEPRLQIVPPASGKGAGTQSGTQAGGEGTMLRQEIQETRETVAARDAEVGELRTRVAELEKIQQQQQQLIAMKDSALAEARANLAKAQQQAAVQPQQATAKDAARDAALWPWLVLALLLVAAGGWLWRKRRGGESRPHIFGARARGLRPGLAGAAPAVATPAPPGKPAPPSFAAPAAASTAAQAAAPAAAPATPPAGSATPSAPIAPAAPAASVAPAQPPAPAQAPSVETAAPHWTSAPGRVGAAPLPEDGASPARQVELARAYLDLGDEPAARALLREALDGRDPVAREIAARMLRDLG